MSKIRNMREFKTSSFTTKAGKHVETKPHFASFNLIHNASKSRVFLVLYHRMYKLRDNTGLGVLDLSLQSGVDYFYIKSRVKKWQQWKYLKCTVRNDKPGKPYYAYTLAERGRHFVEDILPAEWLKTYIEAIREKQYRNKSSGIKIHN